VTSRRFPRMVLVGVGTCAVLAITWSCFIASTGELTAGPLGRKTRCSDCAGEPSLCINGTLLQGEPDGAWYWMRSPEEEKRVVAGLYNRYCTRCHGVDGRGVWDIPDVPDFTNPRWMASRSDAQLARVILEGRGAVMPPFRGALTLEESWAMARYLRIFVPGTEVSRPDYGQAGKPAGETPGQPGKKP
jgi:Cytochrome C oxidase, cbb3-type, subunit III